jgi:biopolymer transport protein ExbB/TolQ
MNLFNTIAHFFQAGGPFMFPILAVGVIGLAIAIERVIYLNKAKTQNRRLWTTLIPLVNRGELAAAEEMAVGSDSPIGRIFGYGIARSRSTTKREEVEMALDESLMEVSPLLERRTHYLATFANVATLLGLLGTIIGLINGFAAVANVNPAEKADQLSSAVSEAMNCTAFGLVIAVPLLLTHAWLSAQTNELIDSLEMAAVKFLNALGLKN